MSAKRHALWAVLALCLVVGPVAGDDLESLENPIKDAQAGEWAKYKVTYSNPMGGPAQEMPAKMTVVKVDPDTVDVKFEMEIMGMPQEQVQTLKKDANLAEGLTEMAGGGGMGQIGNVKVTSSKVEDVEIEHEGKTLKAKKVTMEMTGEFSMGGGGPGMPVNLKNTSWICYDIPVSGLAKADTTIQLDMGTGTPMEVKASWTLVEFGMGGAGSGQ